MPTFVFLFFRHLGHNDEGICRRAFFGCGAKLNKTFKTNIIEILILIMCIPRKINFLQLGRYGRRGEQRYRQTFRRDFDCLCFNMNLAADRFQYGMKRLAIAIDPSYVSKAGKKTAHIDRFWSGCVSAVKHGLELLGIAVICSLPMPLSPYCRLSMD